MATSAGIGGLGITALASFPVSMAICAGVGMGARMACNITGVTKAVENFIKKAEEKVLEFKENFENKILLTKEDRENATSNAINKACQAFMEKAKPVAENFTNFFADPSSIMNPIKSFKMNGVNNMQQRA